MNKFKKIFVEYPASFFKKFKGLSIVYPTVIMFLICLVITAALAGTNAITYNRINKLADKKETKAMQRIIKADSYELETVELNKEKYDYYVAKDKGEIKGYIFKISEKGYGGTVIVLIGINTDNTVKAVELLDVSTETPGLGQDTAKEKFTKQFVGKGGELTAVKYGTASNDNDTEINAVASATISSKAVTSAVNKALTISNKINKTEETEETEEAEEMESDEIEEPDLSEEN